MNSVRKDFVFLLVITLLAIAIRLDFLVAGNIILDADEAIVGLMAKHILDGQPIPTFYYGQHYMGSLEAILASFSFKLFGVSSFALKLVPLVFSLLLVPLIYLIVIELGDKRAARISALYIALAPAPLIIWSAKARGGFIETLFFGALSFLLTLRWLKVGGTYWQTFALGVVLGVAWWTNNQIIYFIGPVGLFLFLFSLRQPILKTLNHLGIGVLSFFLGSLPFWLYNFNHKFVSFEMFGGSQSKDIADHLEGLFEIALPMLLGAMRFWQSGEVFPHAVMVAAILYGLLTLAVIWFRKKNILELLIAKVSREPVELFFFFVFFAFAVFVVSSFGWLVQAPRYLLPTYVGIAVLFGWSISRIWESARPLAGVLFLGVFALNIGSSYMGGRALPGEPFVFSQDRVSRDHTELLKWLKDSNIHFIHTNYWIGYRIAFETNEDVKFSIFGEPGTVRIRSYENLARQIAPETVPYVLVPSEAFIVKRALRLLKHSFDELNLSGYVVLYNLKIPTFDGEQLPSDSFTLDASLSHEKLANALDGDLFTRWCTAQHQSPGQSFTVKFNKPEIATTLIARLGEYRHDYPRALEVFVEFPTGESKRIVSPEDYDALEYFDKSIAEIDVPLPDVPISSITLVQKGKHPILDWSIAEIEVWRRK